MTAHDDLKRRKDIVSEDDWTMRTLRDGAPWNRMAAGALAIVERLQRELAISREANQELRKGLTRAHEWSEEQETRAERAEAELLASRLQDKDPIERAGIITFIAGKDIPETIGHARLQAVRRTVEAESARDAALAEREQMRAALAELVRLKDLHDGLEADDDASVESLVARDGANWHLKMMDRQGEYARCKPLAWEAARALAKEKPQQEEP